MFSTPWPVTGHKATAFLLTELISNTAICKFYTQYVGNIYIATGIIENSYGEDSHYLHWRMAALCSFSSITRSKCESSRGCKESVHLSGCNSNISTHLIKHHLLRESGSEKDPIFARAGLLEITEEQMQKMTVCPAHRHGWESTGRHRKLANIQDTKEKNRQFLEHMLLISRQLVKYKNIASRFY